jgi:hypothetical protein
MNTKKNTHDLHVGRTAGATVKNAGIQIPIPKPKSKSKSTSTITRVRRNLHGEPYVLSESSGTNKAAHTRSTEEARKAEEASKAKPMAGLGKKRQLPEPDDSTDLQAGRLLCTPSRVGK